MNEEKVFSFSCMLSMPETITCEMVDNGLYSIDNVSNISVTGHYSILLGGGNTNNVVLTDDSTLGIICGNTLMKTELNAYEHSIIIKIINRMKTVLL